MQKTLNRPLQNNLKLRSGSSDKVRYQFLSNKLRLCPEKFWNAVAAIYEPADDGESEKMLLERLSQPGNIKIYFKIYEKLKGETL